jgi:hypothetical protein
VPEIADPWWRETILLYVAQADADPIVASCLEYYAGNVDILALAADCAEEARQLSPDLRSQLEELLSSEAAQEDNVRRQLIAKTMLTRKLRRSVPLQGGGYLCGYAVTNAEYNFFLRDMALGGEFRVPDHQITHGLGDPSSPVTGLRSNDAIRFVMWTRSLGFNVRLPAHDELLGSDASDRTFNPSKQAAWVTKPGRRRLDSRLQVEVSASSSATLPLIPVEGRSMESSRRLIEGLQESVANPEKRPPWPLETGLRTPPLAARRAVPDQTGSRPLSGGGLFVHYDATTLSLTNMGKSGRVLDAERVLTARICRDSVALVRAFMHGGDAGMRALAEEIQRMRGTDTPGWEMYKRFRADSVGHSRTSADERAKMAVQRVLAALQRIPRRDPSWLVRQDTPAVPSSLDDPSQIHEAAALMTNKVDLDRLVDSAFNGQSEARAWLGQHSQHSEATMAWQVGRLVVAHALNLAFTREHASVLGGLVLAGMRSLARIAILDVIACLCVLEGPKHGAAFTQPLKQLYMGMLADLVVVESRIEGSLSATEVLLLVLE